MRELGAGCVCARVCEYVSRSVGGCALESRLSVAECVRVYICIWWDCVQLCVCVCVSMRVVPETA